MFLSAPCSFASCTIVYEILRTSSHYLGTKKYVLKVHDNTSLKCLQREALKSIQQTAQLCNTFHSLGCINQTVFLGFCKTAKVIKFLSHIKTHVEIYLKENTEIESWTDKWYVIHHLQKAAL